MSFNKDYADIIKEVSAEVNMSEKDVIKIVKTHYKNIALRIAEADLHDPESFPIIHVSKLFSLIPMERQVLRQIHKKNRKAGLALEEYKPEIGSVIVKNAKLFASRKEEFLERKRALQARNNIFNNHSRKIMANKPKEDEDIHNGE